jgi:3-oxoacyl-[acyl-carrier-protein] synthase II
VYHLAKMLCLTGGSMRRVVVTGLGMVTPLACGVEETWSRLLAGQSGAGPITRFDTTNVVTQYACEIPLGDGSDGTFNPDDWMEPKDRRKVDDFILYGMAAATQAVRDAGIRRLTEAEKLRTGVMIGSGIGGLTAIADTAVLIKEKGPKRVSPFFIPGALINLVSGQVSIRFGFKGPNHAVVTACSTGAHAIGDAARLIMWGDADMMVAGGAEARSARSGSPGSTPARRCRPSARMSRRRPAAPMTPTATDSSWARARGGGAGGIRACQGARREDLCRGAGLWPVGRRLSHHRPFEDGDGGYRSMQAALKRAGITPDRSTTSTPMAPAPWPTPSNWARSSGCWAMHAAKATMSSTKSSIGHLLGAAGAVEAIFCVLAIRDQIAPPTINLDNPAVAPKLDLAPNRAVRRKIDVALSNSFGFGGTNASLVLGKVR